MAILPFSVTANSGAENSNAESSSRMRSVAVLWPETGQPPVTLESWSRTVSSSSTHGLSTMGTSKLFSSSPGRKTKVPATGS